jgi:integrase
VVNLLREVRGTQQLSKIEFGPLWENTGFVFIHPSGTPLIPDQITQDFASLVKRFGLPPLTLHGLRHAYATLALRQGVQPKVVSKAMGHSTIGITMDLYQHVLDEIQDELADAISNVLIEAD